VLGNVEVRSWWSTKSKILQITKFKNSRHQQGQFPISEGDTEAISLER